MEPGFIAGTAYGGHQEKWCPGLPEVSFFAGLKTEKGKMLPVTTMRCPHCGALESYARPA